MSVPPLKKKKIPGWLIITAGIFLFLVLLILSFYFGYQQVYAQKFYRGVFLAEIDLNGKTYNQAEAILQAKIDEISRAGFLFSYKDHQVIITPHVSSTTDPDISYDLVDFDIEKSLNQALEVGRQGNHLARAQEQLKTFIYNKKFDFNYQLDENKFLEALKQNFSELENPSQNAQLIVKKEADQYITEVATEKIGEIFDYQLALEKLKENLKDLNNSKIELNLITDIPQIKQSQTGPALQEFNPLLAKSPLTLRFEHQKWAIDQDKLAELLDFCLTENKITLGLGQEKFFTYLAAVIAPQVNQETKDAKFKLVNGRVAEFQGAQEGRTINQLATLNRINQEFIRGEIKEIELIVETTQPQVPTADVNDLGISEIIGIGISDFSGSPANRRHNIQNAAYNTLNGMIIKPAEEFSLVTALGPINAQTGYLPELVIKGNRTIPEYGGGLCQIGTTIFRAALASGLPITERRPHSYRVVYYEPAGMDATIYIPHPDVRFINDTGNHILIQSKIEGNILKFEFWGTQDGRTTWYSGQQESDYLYDVTPKIWNFIYPPPTKYIESVDIPVGSKRCTEGSHVGATTEFTYRITYPDGEVKEETFQSVYKPWQAVCLVGVEELSTPPEEEVEEKENGGAEQ